MHIGNEIKSGEFTTRNLHMHPSHSTIYPKTTTKRLIAGAAGAIRELDLGTIQTAWIVDTDPTCRSSPLDQVLE